MPPSKAENNESTVSAEAHSQARSNGHKSSDLEGKDNEWKFREPYKIHDKNAGFNALYEAGCHCGRVKYEISRERPLSAKFCHCTTCQTLHGAPFQWAAIFEKSDINFTHGHHDLAWYESGEKTTRHKLPCKVSCAYCGSWIMDEGRKMILLFPSLIKFKGREERERFASQMHMFYGQRCVDVRDGLPKWDGMNEASELLEVGEGELKLDRAEVEQKMKEKKEKEEKKDKEDRETNAEKKNEQEENKEEGNDDKNKNEGKRKSDESDEDEKVIRSQKQNNADGKRYDLR